MTSKIAILKNSIITEITKQKKTLALWGSVIAPLFVITVNFLIFFSRPKILQSQNVIPWLKVVGNATNIYTILMLPLLVTLIAYIVNNVEHKSNGWKHLYALPVNRVYFYLSKIIVAAGMVLLSLVIFVVLVLLSIKSLALAHSQINFAKTASVNLLIINCLKVFLASLFILMIQFVISINIKNFMVPIGTGVVATIGTSMLLSWEHSNWIPYALPMLASQGLYRGDYSLLKEVIIYSVIGSIVIFAGGIFTIRNKNIN